MDILYDLCYQCDYKTHLSTEMNDHIISNHLEFFTNVSMNI